MKDTAINYPSAAQSTQKTLWFWCPTHIYYF